MAKVLFQIKLYDKFIKCAEMVTFIGQKHERRSHKTGPGHFSKFYFDIVISAKFTWSYNSRVLSQIGCSKNNDIKLCLHFWILFFNFCLSCFNSIKVTFLVQLVNSSKYFYFKLDLCGIELCVWVCVYNSLSIFHYFVLLCFLKETLSLYEFVRGF